METTKTLRLILQSLRENPLVSLFLWTAIVALVAGFACGLNLSVAVLWFWVPVSLFMETVGFLFCVMAVCTAQNRGWSPAPYVGATVFCGSLGYQLAVAIF